MTVPALMLKYQTDLKISDLPALRKEVEEIWSVFKADRERANQRGSSRFDNQKCKRLQLRVQEVGRRMATLQRC